MIARLHAGHALTHLHDDTRALVTQDRGKQPLGVGTGQGELIGVADAGRLDLDQNLARFGAFEVHIHDLKRLSGLGGHGGTRSHSGSLPGCRFCQT